MQQHVRRIINMTKKIISVFLAVLLVFSFTAVAAHAGVDDPSEPATEYTHKMSELEIGMILQPGDTIEVDNESSSVLIIEYKLPAAADKAETYSENGHAWFKDNNKTTGYAIKAIGETTSATDKTGTPVIDFANRAGYEFKGWELVDTYSESNYNQIWLIPIWRVPALTGWAGFVEMFNGYLKQFVDFLIFYIYDLIGWLSIWDS